LIRNDGIKLDFYVSIGILVRRYLSVGIFGRKRSSVSSYGEEDRIVNDIEMISLLLSQRKGREYKVIILISA
jgi:hypothetical protein